jgi:hypothetical protein
MLQRLRRRRRADDGGEVERAAELAGELAAELRRSELVHC